jgi:hypothetical protein
MNNEPDKTPDQQFEKDLAAIAVHEAGHFECNREFGLHSTMKVIIDGEGNVHSGWCASTQESKPFEDGVICWGGVIAEYLAGHVYRHGPPVNLFPLNEKFLTRWHDEMLCHIEKMSEGDRCGILHSPISTLESCQYCFRVLSRRLPELREDAAMLAARTRTERAAKLAAAREAKAILKRLETETRTVLINGKPHIPVSIAGRAIMFRQWLEGLHPKDPRRVRLAPALESFEHGVVPELNGELRLTKEEMEALKP